MSSELIKLIITIEKNANLNKEIQTSRSEILASSRSPKTVHSNTRVLVQKSTKETQEKRQRRTLRSKIAKILNSLPKKCEKQIQQENIQKWNENKRKLYELNTILEEKGFQPVNKLNISTNSDKSLIKSLSPKEALIKNLSEKELILFSEDPFYFMQNKKYLITNTKNDWNKLIENDPKDPENIKKGIKLRTDIDFLEKEKKTKKNFKHKTRKTPAKELKIQKVSKNTLKNTFKHNSKDSNPESFSKFFNTSTLPKINILDKVPTSLQTSEKKRFFDLPQSTKVLKKHSPVEFQKFSKISKEFEDIQKKEIIQLAKEFKLFGVKYLLSKWEKNRKSL